jgi:hypothetical protein
LITVRAKGIYDKTYQIKETICTHVKNITIINDPNLMAAIKVKTKEVVYKMVAVNRDLSNMLFSCLVGPTKNIVPHSKKMLPQVKKNANFAGAKTMMGTKKIANPRHVDPINNDKMHPTMRCVVLSENESPTSSQVPEICSGSCV